MSSFRAPSKAFGDSEEGEREALVRSCVRQSNSFMPIVTYSLASMKPAKIASSPEYCQANSQ